MLIAARNGFLVGKPEDPSYPVDWIMGKPGVTIKEITITSAMLPLIWDAKTGFIVDLLTKNASSGIQCNLLYKTWSGTGQFGLAVKYGNYSIQSGLPNYNQLEFSRSNIANTRTLIRYSADGSIYLNDTLLGQTSKITPGSWTSSHPLYLLYSNSKRWIDPIYRFQITHDDIVQADFKPWCDYGIYGFKELISGEFFGNETLVGSDL